MTEQLSSVYDRLMKSDLPPGDHEGSGGQSLPPRSSGLAKRIAIWMMSAVAFIGVGFGASQLPLLVNTPTPADAKDTRQSVAQTNQTNQINKAGKAEAANDPFLTHAADAGVTACAAVYSSLGQALTNGTDFMVQTQMAANDANKHTLQGTVGMAFRSEVEGGYKGAAAGVVFASPVAGGCEGAMVRVVPFAQNCETAATFLPSGSKALQPLTGLSHYALSGGGQAILMPSSQGCVAISIVRGGA